MGFDNDYRRYYPYVAAAGEALWQFGRSFTSTTEPSRTLRSNSRPNMVGSYGSSRKKLPKTVVNAGDFSYGKRMLQQEDYVIGNITQANPLYTGNGKNLLKFNSNTGEMPVWVCDLSTLCNAISMSAGTTYAYKASPWYKLNFTKGFSGGTQTWNPWKSAPTGTDLDAPFFENIGWQYTLEQSSDGNMSAASPPNINFGKNAILKWIDFRGLFYGTNNRTTDWFIDIVHIKDPALHLIPAIDMKYTDGTAPDDDVQRRRLFWSEVARKLVANPLVPQFESWRGKVKTVYREKIHIDEKETTYNSLHSREKRIFLKLNKLLNYQWRNLQKYQNNTTLTGSIVDPSVIDLNYSIDPLAAPDQRLYLIIRATSNLDYYNNASNKTGGNVADGTLPDGKTGFWSKSGTAVGVNFERQDGVATSGNSTDAAKVAGQAGPYELTSIDNQFGSKITRHIAYMGPSGNKLAQDNTLAVGADVPTFDFVLRAKWVYSPQL